MSELRSSSFPTPTHLDCSHWDSDSHGITEPLAPSHGLAILEVAFKFQFSL